MTPKLEAVNPPLGPQPFNAVIYSSTQVTLHMREKLLSLTDDFTIKTVNGAEVCRCQGKLLSTHDSKKFCDPAGNELFTLRNKVLALNKSFEGKSPHGKHDFHIKGHFKLMGTHSTVTFKNAADGQEVELEVKGDWLDRNAEITWGGRTVATIGRKLFDVREIFADKSTYFVHVAPNVDLSLIAGICVSLDEKEGSK